MKIKTIKKYEDDARLINVNFVTSMIENPQVTIGMKYFVVEWYNKGKMRYDVDTALDELGLVSILADCASGMSNECFVHLIDDIIQETPPFCYVYDNIWQHVLWKWYGMGITVNTVAKNINNDINAYHNCKLYDLMNEYEIGQFEYKYPNKEYKSPVDDKMYPTPDYTTLYSILWRWFNQLTNGKYERVNGVIYSKAKKVEEKMSTLEYKDMSDGDKAEIAKFIDAQLTDKGWYHNTGSINFVTADGRKLKISNVDTLDLAVTLENSAKMIGDYLLWSSSAIDWGKMFNGADIHNPVSCVCVDRFFKKALRMEEYNENLFYESNTPYGCLGYDIRYHVKGMSERTTETIYFTQVNNKSVKFTTSDKLNPDEDEIQKRPLSPFNSGEEFNYFGSRITPRCTNFSPEALMFHTREKAERYYNEAVKKFGKPILEQEVTEQELAAATENV